MHLLKVGFICLLVLLLSTIAHAKIVFGSNREGVEGVYVMDDDGSNQTLLTESETLIPYPGCWSPDGKQILFKGRGQARNGNVVFLMNTDGTNIRQITADDGRYIGATSFSPDGKSIVFDTRVRINDKQKASINVLNIATGKMKEIADIGATHCNWSPDGKYIVFAEPLAVGGVGGTIWIMEAGGHNPRPLIPPHEGAVTFHRWKPCWSPDGKQILFSQEEYTWEQVPDLGNALIPKAYRYIICDQKGENIKQLQIPKAWRPIGIDWMDDGKSVVFSTQDGIPLNEPIPRGFVFPPGNIYKYHISTGKITQLTDHPGKDHTLDWISDDVLSVSAVGKKKVTWGVLKQ